VQNKREGIVMTMLVPPPNNGGNQRRFVPINPPMSAQANRITFKRAYTKLIGAKLDLKISHKKKIYPNQILILGRNGGRRSATLFKKGKVVKSMFECQDTVTGQYTFLTYYEIQRYYLGRKNVKIKGHRLLVPTFQIVSNPTVPYSQLYTKKYNILERTRERMKEDLKMHERKKFHEAWDNFNKMNQPYIPKEKDK
jgi:hypothetical protein